MSRCHVLTVALVLVPTLSLSQDLDEPKKKPKLGIGLTFGAYYPTDKKVIRATSSSSYSFGLSPTNIYYREGLQQVFDLNMNGVDLRGSRYFVVTPSVGLVQVFGDKAQESQFKPFVAARIGVGYADFSILEAPNSRVRGKHFTLNGNVEIGLFLSEKLRISARYDAYGKTKNFKFDGLSAGVTWQFARF